MEEIQKLTKVLEEELVLHQQMLPLLQQERETVIHRKAKDLVDVLKEKEALVETIRKKEHERQALVIHLAHVLNIPHQKLTMTVLAARLKDKNLLKIKEQFTAVLDDVHDQQQKNNQLIQKGHDFIRECISQLHSSAQDPCYGPEGQYKTQPSQQGFFDKKI